jgi:hypothetical protein
MLSFYYRIKPVIPRRMQIYLRRKIVREKMKNCGHVWPVDPRANCTPANWQGWPDGKRFALVLQHDVDTMAGHDKCLQLMDLDKRLGFRSSFNFVPERYSVSSSTRHLLTANGFGVGVHGLTHDGKLFSSRQIFDERVIKINRYLRDWDTKGFSSPSMFRNLDWMHEMEIDYSTSTFDTDPFEPQPEGAGTIFPMHVSSLPDKKGFIELPYTLPQDHTLFVIMQEKDNRIWKEKLRWIVEHGGMALLNTHPDYMRFDGRKCGLEEYPVEFYSDFLEHVKKEYEGQYWHALPKEVAGMWLQGQQNSNIEI